jgi:DNA-binding NarL/FixJ family response regulator
MANIMKRELVRVLLTVQPGIYSHALGVLLEQASFDIVDWAASRELPKTVRAGPAPSIAILDAEFGSARVFELANELRGCFPALPFLLLVEPNSEPDVVDTFRAGMRGYLLKTDPGAEMVVAVRAVLRGDIYISPQVLSVLIPQLLTAAKDCKACVTAHDKKLLKAIADGKSMVEASAHLGVAYEELLVRRRQLQTNLGIRDTAGLVRYAVQQKIVTP